MKARIQQYRFSDSKAGIITAAAIHLICGLTFYMVAEEAFLSPGRAQLCLVIAVTLAVLYRLYEWKDTITNVLIIGVFIAGLFYEWSAFGIPEAAMTLGSSNYSKGFITTAIIQMLPWFYAGLRVLCVCLLLHITWEAYRLNEKTN